MSKYARIYLILLFVTCFTEGIPFASALVINEIMYDLPGSDTGREWIEVYNEGSVSISVATGTDGWRFYDGTNHLISDPLQDGIDIAAGGYAIITADAAVFMAEHAGFAETVFDTVMSLANAGDLLRVLDADAVILNEVVYVAEWGAAGNGKTLERQPDGSWRESALDGGTPGVSNSIPPVPTPTPLPTPSPSELPIATPAATPDPSPQTTSTPTPSPQTSLSPSPQVTPTLALLPLPNIRINEFLPNAEVSDEEGEWIEIWNAGGNIADISGWKLDDAEGGSAPYAFPANTVISALGYGIYRRPTTAIALNNESDEVRLITPGGQVYVSVAYDKSPKGASSNRLSSGGYVWSYTPTPGGLNRISADPLSSPAHTTTSSSTEPKEAPSQKTAVAMLPTEQIIETEQNRTRFAATRNADSIKKTIGKPSNDGSAENEKTTTSISRNFIQEAALLNTASKPYQSFFSRYAIVFVFFLALFTGVGIVKWRRHLNLENHE